MHQSEKIRNFYNKYGVQEWERLDKTPYDRLNFLLYMNFIDGYINEETDILDVGCGAGRFSIEFAKKGERSLHIRCIRRTDTIGKRKARTVWN